MPFDKEGALKMGTETPPQIDRLKLNRLLNDIREKQNLSLGVMIGLLAAVLGAVIWGAITYATGYQIGYMAIGVGILVGLAVRQFGQGIDKVFGFSGALLALLGCLMGNIFATCIFISNEYNMGVMTVVSRLDLTIITAILKETFAPIDILFYAIATYEGYKFSFRKISGDELAALSSQ